MIYQREDINTAVIERSDWKAISDASNSESNDMTGLTIRLDAGGDSFDAKAMTAGENTKFHIIWYLREDGKLEAIPCSYTNVCGSFFSNRSMIRHGLVGTR